VFFTMPTKVRVVEILFVAKITK